MNTGALFREEVSALFEQMQSWRRHCHRHPELSFEETETQAFVLRELEKLGIQGTKVARTGVLARLGPKNGDAIALRADMDALPVTEATGLPFTSENQGVAHACGHDGHIAGLLGVAAVLSSNKNYASLKRGVVLLFQPAEEGHHGIFFSVFSLCASLLLVCHIIYSIQGPGLSLKRVGYNVRMSACVLAFICGQPFLFLMLEWALGQSRLTVIAFLSRCLEGEAMGRALIKPATPLSRQLPL